MLVWTPSTVRGLAHSSLCGAAAPWPSNMSTSLRAGKFVCQRLWAWHCRAHSAKTFIECSATSASSAAKKSSTNLQTGMWKSRRAKALSSWPWCTRNGCKQHCKSLHLCTDSFPVVHTANGAEHARQVLCHIYLPMSAKGDVCILPVFWQQWDAPGSEPSTCNLHCKSWVSPEG